MARKTFIALIAAVLLFSAGVCKAQEPEEEFKKKPPAEPPKGADGQLLPPLEACQFFMSKGETDDALPYCRQAYEASPTMEAAKLLARCEFAAGDSDKSARLWQEVMDKNGWSYEASDGRANALWRSGDTKSAEKLFLEDYDRQPSGAAVSEIMRFYLGFSRWGEAEAWGEKAMQKYPKDCHIMEMLASAKAALGKDKDAADLIKKSMAAKCEPYRWASISGISERLSLPVYKSLLDPKDLARGLNPSDKEDCLNRLMLLRIVETPVIADAVADAAMKTKDVEVRYLSLSILQDLGAPAMGAWAKLFSSDDFVLRKYAFRRQLDMQNPAFNPLLEKALATENLPGNKNLLEFALGKNLLLGQDPARGERLLRAVPEDDPIFSAVALKLSEVAEGRKDYAQALDWLEKAMKKAPDLAKDGGRLQRLKELAGKP